MKHPPVYAYLPSVSGAATMATMSECPFGPAGPTAVEVPACPFATEAGFYEPRRLSILDFLLWMTVAAAMLGVRVTLAEEPAGRASGWFYGGYQAVLAICGAACVVGLGLRDVRSRSLPGGLVPLGQDVSRCPCPTTTWRPSTGSPGG